MLVQLQHVVQVHVVPAVDVVAGVESAGERGGAVAAALDHLFVLGLRIPAHVVAEVDAAHADRGQRRIVRVAVLPDVGLLQRVEHRRQVVGFAAHQVVVLPVTARHLDLVLVRVHADLLQPLVRAPQDQRDAVAHRRLHREDGLAGQAVPVVAAEVAQRRAGDLLHRVRVDVLLDQVAVEADAQVRQVADAQRCVEVLVVGDQQRVQSESLLDEVDDVVRIARAADGHDAVVGLSAAAAVRRHQRFEALPALGPVEAVLLLVHTAAGADALGVEHQPERVRAGVQAAAAVHQCGHVFSSRPVRGRAAHASPRATAVRPMTASGAAPRARGG